MSGLTSTQVAILCIAAGLSLLSALIMLGLAIVGYFLKDTHGRAKTTENTVAEHKVEIAELKVKTEGVEKSLDEIKTDVRTGNTKLDSVTALLISAKGSRR